MAEAQGTGSRLVELLAGRPGLPWEAMATLRERPWFERDKSWGSLVVHWFVVVGSCWLIGKTWLIVVN